MPVQIVTANAGGGRHRVLIAIATVAAVLIAMEGLFRIFPSLSPEGWAVERLKRFSVAGSPAMREIAAFTRTQHFRLLPDPYLGASEFPLQHKTHKTLDYTYLIETDSHGFPNREPWPDRVDAVVLGNSLIEGSGVGIDGQFTTLLSQHFGGRSFFNLGLTGGGTETQLRIYKRFGAALHPKLVIATLWPVWEVDNTEKFAHWLTEHPSLSFTEYRLAYGVKHAAPKQRRGWLSNLAWKSAVFRAAYLAPKALMAHSPYTEVVTFRHGEKMYLSPREQLRLSKGIVRPGTPNIASLFVEPLENLRRAVEAQGGRLLVVLVPSREEIYGAAAAPQVLNTIHALKPLLESAKLPVLDTYPIFSAQAMARPLYFPRDMHLNAAGNALLAAAIAERIERDGFGLQQDSAMPAHE